MNQMTTKSKDDKIRDFCKLQHACQQFLESLKIIYDLGVTHEDLEDLVNSEDAVDQALAVSPCMSIASYLKLLKDSVNLMEIYDYYEFDPDETPVDEFITMKHISPSESSSNTTTTTTNDDNTVTEDMNRLKIDTTDIEESTKNVNEPPISNNKKKNEKKENPSDNSPQPTKKTSKPDSSLSSSINNNHKNNQSPNRPNKKDNNNNNKNSYFSNKANNNDNKKNTKKKNPTSDLRLTGKTRKLDPSLDDNSSPSSASSHKRFGSSSNNNSNNNNNNSDRKFSRNEKTEDTNTEASLKLDAALSKYKLASEYTIRQLKNGSFEATCRIKGLNIIISKGYGRDKKTAQHNAANMAFTSQALLDILSSKM